MRQAMVWYSSQPLASTSSAGSGVCTCTAPSTRCQCARTCAIATQPEAEDQLAFGAIVQRHFRLQHGAGVEPGAEPAGELLATEPGRHPHAAIAAEDLETL